MSFIFNRSTVQWLMDPVVGLYKRSKQGIITVTLIHRLLRLLFAMRLDKYIASVTDFSRSQVKRAIKNKQVRIEDEVITNARHDVNDGDQVYFEGELLRQAGCRYFMLNKPEGYVCASKDRLNMTVLELVDGEDNVESLHAAGRLDIDTTGLVLLTDDGQWSHRITSPKSLCKKTYYVETAEPIAPEVIDLFCQGVELKGEMRPTLPAELELIHEQAARLTISEGKYHQVKRMFAFTGNRVESLHRERIGNIVLDEDLPLGAYRLLTEEEVACV